MPVEAPEGSLSPLQRQASLSPERTDAGPSKKPRNTVADQQRRQVEKLLSNPEREIQINVGTKEKTLRAPREMMKNVQGSSAGAGSGEFHVYKQSRRREYERLKMMNDKAHAEEEQAAFQARQAERDAMADAKTAKNRAKRQKRKQGKKGDSSTPTPTSTNVTTNGEVNENGKRKLAGGASIKFKRPGEDSDEDDKDEEDTEDIGPIPTSIPELTDQEIPKAVEEKRITIVDED
ncbi:uncharacterized protein I206_107745 [Kwoniella pini CBS 10737]|uniref:PRKR-interacting protein 1 n=1 Tax=Kwoniella pini CBS 10737 TaxID=1296096 RepID=A0A1B9HY82_9TREE|nr:uncharacterized protein I206_06079 [Kwoniella pini CBS 10737]OCF48211.1 hypothetical protein I206_06079 [Kwoniella pini CBS 10737]